MDIDKELVKLIKENVIDEGSKLEAKVLLTWLDKGRKEAEKVSKKIVKNLVKFGFAKGDKLLCSFKKGKETIWFCLAVNGAKGFIKQVKGG